MGFYPIQLSERDPVSDASAMDRVKDKTALGKARKVSLLTAVIRFYSIAVC